MRFLKSREYAEDIFQDTFTVIWESRRFINPDTSFSSYLYTIMRNRILNQLRELASEDRLKEQILSQAIDYSNETNNENLDDNRKVFYEELKDRVKNLSLYDAVLEVNHWCHEKVIYTPSDGRTSSPLASVKTAYRLLLPLRMA